MNDHPRTTAGSTPRRTPASWRRWLFSAVALATLIALFYAVENWRGRRAWERHRRELEARGERLDWEHFKPKPVPADQDFFQAPFMEAFFNRQTSQPDQKALVTAWAGGTNLLEHFRQRHGVGFPVLEVSVATPGLDGAGTPWPRADFEVGDHESFRRNLARAAGLVVLPHPTGLWSILAADPTARLTRIRFSPASNQPPAEVVKLFDRFGCKAQPAGPGNVWRVVLRDAVVAEDLLAWYDRFAGSFQAIATAARRPEARLPGNYDDPLQAPIPDFLTLRTATQGLAGRAQCWLLTGRPDQALEDVQTILRLARACEQSSPTLVSAMMGVAVTGLALQVVGEGFLEGLWQEPQWAALQDLCGAVDLLPSYQRAIRVSERAGMLRLLERVPSGRLAQAFGDPHRSPWSDPVGRFLLLAPRGWIAQNQVWLARGYQQLLDACDQKSGRIFLDRQRQADATMQEIVQSAGPYRYLARLVLPNLAKAWGRIARTQTLAREAAFAAALERCRRATGSYPETLAALVPRFLPAAPRDPIAGEPFRYRRTSDGRYLLYGVGLDGKDRGGAVTNPESFYSTDDALGWPFVPRR